MYNLQVIHCSVHAECCMAHLLPGHDLRASFRKAAPDEFGAPRGEGESGAARTTRPYAEESATQVHLLEAVTVPYCLADSGTRLNESAPLPPPSLVPCPFQTNVNLI